MASNQFVAVNWNPGQLVDEDTLDQMNSNMTYLRDQSVDGLYQHRLGGTTDVGLKILCGQAAITPRKTAQGAVTISFARMFSPNSTPIVTASQVCTWTAYMTMVTTGIGRILPNQQGFIARVVNIPPGKAAGRIKGYVYINWIAMGY